MFKTNLLDISTRLMPPAALNLKRCDATKYRMQGPKKDRFDLCHDHRGGSVWMKSGHKICLATKETYNWLSLWGLWGINNFGRALCSSTCNHTVARFQYRTRAKPFSLWNKERPVRYERVIYLSCLHCSKTCPPALLIFTTDTMKIKDISEIIPSVS